MPSFFTPGYNIKAKQPNLQNIPQRSSPPPPHPRTLRHFTLPYESLQFNSTAKVAWEQLIWERGGGSVGAETRATGSTTSLPPAHPHQPRAAELPGTTDTPLHQR